MGYFENFVLAAVTSTTACASSPERKLPVQHINAPICAKLASGEAVGPKAWPATLGNTVDEVRNACAETMNDPQFCPYATSVGLSRTDSLHPGILPSNLAKEARDRCLELLKPKGKDEKCTPQFDIKVTQ